MIRITNLEKALLEFAVEKGYLHLGDFEAAYTNKYARRNAIAKFLSIKVMRETEIPHRFKIDEEKIRKCVNL